MSQSSFCAFLLQKQFARSVREVFARDVLLTGEYRLFVQTNYSHFTISLSSFQLCSSGPLHITYSPQTANNKANFKHILTSCYQHFTEPEPSVTSFGPRRRHLLSFLISVFFKIAYCIVRPPPLSVLCNNCSSLPNQTKIYLIAN